MRNNSVYFNLITLVVFVITVFGSNCQIDNTKDDIANRIEAQIDSLIHYNSNIEAVSLGIVTPSRKYIIHKGRLLNGQKPSNETLYEIASITKTFTGGLLSHAILDNKIDIDDNIKNYLPEKYSESIGNHQISFRNLATHRSGLPLFFPHHKELFESALDWDKLPFEINRLQQNFSQDQFFESLSRFKLETIPGTRTIYSNAGTNLIGYLLENIYEKSFEELLADKILNPLNMTNSTISFSKTDKKKIAKGFNENKIKMPFRVEKEMNAEGGIISNIDDMMKYLNYHLNLDSKISAISHMRLINEKPNNYHEGLFWQLKKEDNQHDVLYQIGGAFGTSSWISIVPELKTGIFIVTNSSGSQVHQNLEESVDKIFKLVN